MSREDMCAKGARTEGVGLPGAAEYQEVTPTVPDTGIELKGLALALLALVLPLSAMNLLLPFKMGGIYSIPLCSRL